MALLAFTKLDFQPEELARRLFKEGFQDKTLTFSSVFI